MNPTTLRQTASRSTRSLSSKASSSSSSPSSSSSSYYPPSKSNGRTLPSSTIRSLISLHHSSIGFLHNPKEELSIGFDNVFRYTRGEPFYRSYSEFNNSVSFNKSLNPPGGLVNLIEKPKNNEAKGLEFKKGKIIQEQEGLKLTFKSKKNKLWSQQNTSLERGNGGDNQFLSDRELKVKEALFGTWERSSKSQETKIEPSLDGLLEFLEAKGKSIENYAEEWKNRDKDNVGGKKVVEGTEDGL